MARKVTDKLDKAIKDLYKAGEISAKGAYRAQQQQKAAMTTAKTPAK
jgi:hypothetical protein